VVILYEINIWILYFKERRSKKRKRRG
jgi:hypothetical protein